jgi:hypothetical protein
MERRTAVLLLRPRTGEVSAGVTWPAAGGRARAAALLLAPDRFGGTSRAEYAAALANGSGYVVVDLRCGGTGPRSAGGVDAGELGVAAYTLGWLADHAAELGAEAAEVVVVSVPPAVETARAVTARARAEGWPRVARHAQIDEFAAAGPSNGERD